MQTAEGKALCILPCLFSFFCISKTLMLCLARTPGLFFCHGRFYWSVLSLMLVAVFFFFFCCATGEKGKYQRRSWGGEREDGAMAGMMKERVGRVNGMDGS